MRSWRTVPAFAKSPCSVKPLAIIGLERLSLADLLA